MGFRLIVLVLGLLATLGPAFAERAELEAGQVWLLVRTVPLTSKIEFLIDGTWEEFEIDGTRVAVSPAELPGELISVRLTAPGYLPRTVELQLAKLRRKLSPDVGAEQRQVKLRSKPLKLVPNAPLKVVFHCDPAEASLYRPSLDPSKEPDYIGAAGSPLVITPFQGDVLIRAEGYEDSTFRVDWDYWQSAGQGPLRIPPRGVISLVAPEGSTIALRTWFKEHRLLAGVLGFFTLFGVLGLVRKNRSLGQEKRASEDRLEKAKQAPNDLYIGRERLSGYEVEGFLGKGGMATVYSGREHGSQQVLALKILDEHAFAEYPESRQRFEREVRTLMSLNHLNIVRLDHWGEADTGAPFLVLEFVDGGTLRTEIRAAEGGLSFTDFLALGQQIVAGVDHAHSKGVVHRDLKPENIMLTAGKIVKIADFGLARGHEYTTLTVTGSAFGTPAYMPPEQMGAAEVGAHSDQYSLGVIFYEMLTGHRPFEQEELMAVLAAQMMETPPRASLHRPDLPPAVDQALGRMLEKEGEDRFPDVKSAFQALSEALR